MLILKTKMPKSRPLATRCALKVAAPGAQPEDTTKPPSLSHGQLAKDANQLRQKRRASSEPRIFHPRREGYWHVEDEREAGPVTFQIAARVRLRSLPPTSGACQSCSARGSFLPLSQLRSEEMAGHS